MKLLDCFPMLFAFEYCCCMLLWLWIFCSLWQEILSSQLILLIANDLNPYLLFLNLFQRAKGSTSVHSRSCSDLLRGNKLNIFFVSDCELSQPLSLVHVLVSAGKRVNIWSRSCSDLLKGNKLNTYFVSDCEWSQPLPLVLALVSAGQRVNIGSLSCSDLLQGNKLNTFVSLVWIHYKVLI
jgi:hypothetical protein